MKNVLITGGSGLVGTYLSKKLLRKGYKVSWLTTEAGGESDYKTFYWNLETKEIEKQALDNIDFVIHLAGADIGNKRWTKKRKELIISSRVKSAQLLFDTIKDHNSIKAFISASAVGYYGAITTNNVFTESDTCGHDFLAQTCKLWEEAADRFNDLGIRTVKLRAGVVLSKQKGALAKMIKPIRIGIGSALGSGKQYLPWIHIEDLCELYIKAIEDEQMNGTYNAIAPDQRTNKEFTCALAKTLNKPFWFPNIPTLLLKLLYGDRADILLTGSKISCQKIISRNFSFKFPDLESAFNDLFHNKNNKDY